MSGSRQVKIEILGDSKGGQAAFAALDSAAGKTEGVLGRVTGGLGKFGSAIGSAAKLAGGFIIAKAIYDAPGALLGMAQAAADDAASVGRLQQAIENTGGSWDTYKGQVDDTVAAGQRLGFSDDDVRNALVTLTDETGNAGDAFARLQTAQNLSRGANIDLGTASKLLGKITDDNVGVLKRYGIQVDKNSSAQDLLNKVDERFGGQAAKFAASDAGKVARLKDQWGELQEAIGYKVLPILSALTSFMLDDVIPVLNTMVDVVTNKVMAGWAALSGLLRGPTLAAFRLVRDGFLTFVGALQGNWADSSQVAGLHRVLGNLGVLIRAVVIPAWNLLNQAIGIVQRNFGLIRRVAGDLMTLWGGPFAAILKGMIRGFGTDGIAGILPGAVDGLRKFRDALLDLGGLALDALGSVDWAGLGSRILDGLGGALGSLSSLATSVDWGAVAGSIIDGIVGGFQAVTDFGARWGSWALGQFTGIDWSGVAGSIIDGIVSGFTAVVDFGTRWGGWAVTQFTGIDWSGVATSVIDGIVAGFGAVVDFGTRWGTWAIAQFQAVDWSGLASSILNGVVTGFSAVADFGSRFAAWVQTQVTATDWSGVATAISDGINGALAAVQGAGAGTAGGGFLAGIVGDVSGVIAQIQPFVDFITNNVLIAIGNLKTAWIDFATSLNSNADWSQVVEALKNIATVIGAVVLVALSALTLAWRALTDVMVAIAPILGSVVGGALTSTAALINILADVIKGMVAIVSDLLHGDFSAAWNDAKALVANVIGDWEAGFAGLPAVLGGYAIDIASAVVSGLASLASDGGQAFLDLLQAGSDALTNLLNDAGTKAGDILSAIVSGLASLPSDAGRAFVDFEHDALVTLGNLVIEVGTKAADIISGLVAGLLGGIGQATSAVGSIKDAIVGFFGDASGWLVSAGGDVLTGLWNGMSGMKDWVISQASGLAGSIKDGVVGAFTSAFGISSPSKLMADLVGSPIVGGIAAGMQTAGGLIPGAVASLGQLILDGANRLVNATHAPFVETGDQLAKALVDGIIAGAPSAGDAVSYVSDTVALSLAKMQQDLAGQIDLAKISGADLDSIAKLQAQLDAVTGLLTGWAGHMGVTVTEALDQINVGQAVADQWNSLLGNMDAILSGKAKDDLLATIGQLNQEIELATAAGAPQSIIDGLNASLATTQAQLQQVGSLYAVAVKQGLAGGLTPDDVSSAITTASGIEDGSLLKSLEDQLGKLNHDISTAEALGWSSDLIAAMKAKAKELSGQLAKVSGDMSKAAAAGLLSPDAQKAWDAAAGKMTQLPLDKLAGLLPKLKDFGVSMLGNLADGVAAGTTTLQGALDLINGMVAASMSDLDKTNDLTTKDMIAKLRDLEFEYENQLKQAMIDATDPTAIEANIKAINALLGSIQASADAATGSVNTLSSSLNNISGGPDAAGSGGGAGSGSGGGELTGAPGAQSGSGISQGGITYSIYNTPGSPGPGSQQRRSNGLIAGNTSGAAVTGSGSSGTTATSKSQSAGAGTTVNITNTVNAPDSSPHAIKAALQLVSVRQGQELARLGVGG